MRITNRGSTEARWRPLVAVVLATVLMLTACNPSGDRSTGTAPLDGAGAQGPDATSAAIPPGAEEIYAQDVSWAPCDDGFECAKVAVPLDWSDPAGKSIELAVIRTVPESVSKGTIWLNPGGPGGSGIEMVRDSLSYVATEDLLANYSIAGFDPRGVGASSAVDCLSDADRDKMRESTANPETDEGLEQMRAQYKKFAEACEANTGELLGHVDTQSAARDLDVLREVSGDTRLNYLGFSYGTFLGSTYATLFPEKVGRLVLDGALDPSLSNAELALGQAKGFEGALRAYIEDCQSREGCPLGGDVDDGVKKVQSLFDTVESAPMTASDGRKVGLPLLLSGFILPLYNDQNWPLLGEALAQAFDGSPDEFLRLADLGADREPDGTYSGNGDEAFNAINCLDYPTNSETDTMRAEAEELKDAAPTFGVALGYGGAVCESWPYQPVRTPEPANAPGAEPILVVGTTGDPATPYEWSEALTEQLESSTLLTYEGEGHTAYGRAGACINSKVDAYFIEGKLPAAGTRC
ncbi:alpha/beta hydrolase [Saxibacter everestensis]|uniref:Alpha/beta hydrolase n=1 Tax=Saxibacter everestensis TaxID=2909229 RepID=A0ABY8QPZ7_9MICO|nr:alpha/beta hydrolase [Brevibacteriaceae bacterium ZFBP1038]